MQRNLLVPASYSATIKPMVAQYKERLHPISKREARYRNSIPDLPDVIHITSTVQSNLDFMARLSTADIWTKAPPSIKSPPYAAASTASQSHKSTSGASASSDHSVQWPSLVKRPGQNSASNSSVTSTHRHSIKGKLKHPPRGKSTQISLHSLEDGDHADTTSTHSLTNTLQSIPTSRLTELELEMRECREMLKTTSDTAKDSATRLANTEMHLANTMATLNDLTRNVAGLQTSFNDITRTLENMRHTLHAIASHTTTTTFSYTEPPAIPIANQLKTIQESSRQSELDKGGLASSLESSYRKSPDKKKKRPYSRDDEITRDTAVTDDDGDCSMQLSHDYSLDEQENAEDTQVLINSDIATQQTPQQTPSPPDTQYNIPRDPAGREDK